MTLDDILNEPNEPVQATDTVKVDANTNAHEDADVKSSSTSALKTDAPIDPDLDWDDDEDHPVDGQKNGNEDENEDEDKNEHKDEATEAELDAIEARNKWMKGRIAPVKQKLSKAEEEIARLRAENEQLKSGKPAAEPRTQPTGVPATVDDIVNNDPTVISLANQLKELEAKADTMTEQQYIDAKLDIISDLKIAKREIARDYNNHVNAQQQQIIQAENKIKTDLDQSIMAKKDVYPDIDKAYDRINKNADKIDIEIRRSMIMEGDKINPLAADIFNVIGNDKQIMSYLIAQSNLAKQTGRVPVAAIEYIGRLKAKLAETVVEDVSAPDVESTIKRASTPRKPGIPKDVKTHKVGEPEDLSTWAQQALKSGQRPW